MKQAHKTYGYCRISTPQQRITRQVGNIKAGYPDAIIVEEVFTGTTTDRPAFGRLLRNILPGDTIIFDEVSRMSRNASEGFMLYRKLYDAGVELVFLKEPYLNTEVFRQAVSRRIEMTGTDIDVILAAVNEYLMLVAQRQIESAFTAAQAEVDYLHRRTSEGVRRAQMAGKQVGRAPGSKIETKKAKESKEVIRKHSKDFGGSLTDPECIRLVGIARGTYYKYKREIRAERAEQD